VAPRQRLLQAVLGDEAQLVEARAKPAAVEDLMLDRELELVVADEPAFPQDASQYRQGAPSMRSAILVGYPSDRKAHPHH
jgi:hypothetical protein